MKKHLPLLLLLILFAGCKTANIARNIPVNQQATIDSLSETEILLSPVVKLNWPSLTGFDITEVDDAKISGSKIIVGPGIHTLKINIETQWSAPNDIYI